MSVETVEEAYFPEVLIEEVKKPVTRASHVAEIQKVLPKYRFEQFLRLNNEGHRIILSGAFLDIVEKPRESDLRLADDYIRWFCEGRELESFKRETGTSSEKLEDLIRVMPEMIAAFYADRKTIGSVGLHGTIKVTPKKKKTKAPKNKEKAALSNTTNGVGDETVPNNTIDFPVPQPTDEMPDDLSGKLASVSPIRENIVPDVLKPDQAEKQEQGHIELELSQPDTVDRKSEVELPSLKDALEPVNLDAPSPVIDSETKLKAMVAAAKGIRTKPINSTNQISERITIAQLDDLLSPEARDRYRHVDIFEVALHPGSVSRNELMGAINNMWGDAIVESIVDPPTANYLRARAAGIETSLSDGRKYLKKLEDMAGAYSGRLMDEKLPNVKVIRSVLKQFSMGRTVDELKEMVPGAPVPLLLVGGISEVFRTRISRK